MRSFSPRSVLRRSERRTYQLVLDGGLRSFDPILTRSLHLVQPGGRKYLTQQTTRASLRLKSPQAFPLTNSRSPITSLPFGGVLIRMYARGRFSFRRLSSIDWLISFLIDLRLIQSSPRGWVVGYRPHEVGSLVFFRSTFTIVAS